MDAYLYQYCVGLVFFLAGLTVAARHGYVGLSGRGLKSVLAVVRYGSAELLDLTGVDSWAARACRRANRDLTAEEWHEFIGADVPYATICAGRSAKAFED